MSEDHADALLSPRTVERHDVHDTQAFSPGHGRMYEPYQDQRPPRQLFPLK